MVVSVLVVGVPETVPLAGAVITSALAPVAGVKDVCQACVTVLPGVTLNWPSPTDPAAIAMT